MKFTFCGNLFVSKGKPRKDFTSTIMWILTSDLNFRSFSIYIFRSKQNKAFLCLIRRARYECEEWVTREKNFYCAPSLARKPAFALASRARPRDSTQKEKRGPPFILALNYRTWKTETVMIIMYLSSQKASETILCLRLLILKIYFPTTYMLCHTQAVKSISSSMCEFTGTSTRSNRPQDTRLVFWFSLVKADIFLFTVLVTLTLTNSSSLRSMYSEIFRPLLNPRLSKEASVLLWATIDPPFFRLKAEINNRWSVWKMNYSNNPLIRTWVLRTC